MALTYKNASNTLEHHLERFLDRYNDYKKKGRGFNQFCKIDGAFYSTEYTYNPKTKEWHPHIHIFALLNEWIDQEELSETWHDITLDSYIVDIRRVKKPKNTAIAKLLLRFVNMLLSLVICHLRIRGKLIFFLKGNRLTGCFGSMYGVKLPEKLTDDLPLDDLPYMELLYRFVFGKKSYYDLQITKDVKPH